MSLAPGQLVGGKYRIERLLGRGGMGAVYRAINEALQRPVAIKVLADGGADADMVTRFTHEGIAASRVRHRAIVEIFDAGVHEGAPFIAMELLDGESLANRLGRERPTTHETVAVVREVLSGLAEAHDAGIVHRDIKPDNIFLSRGSDGRIQPKILDFGVAKLGDGEADALTKTGDVLGTAHYLSPEQARGTDVDRRTDLYAIGVILFEALSGDLPFRAPNLPALLVKVVSESPRDLRSLAPHVPDALVEVIESCLARDRERRPADARLLSALLNVAVGEASVESTITQHSDSDVLASMQVVIAESPAPRRTPTRHNLPRESTSFIGRASDLAKIADHLARGARIVTLLGPGGTGKTRLALHLAAARLDGRSGECGVWFCDLTEARSVAAIVDVVGKSMGAALLAAQTVDDAVAQLGWALAERGEQLMVLDNFEQVVDHASATVGRWIERAPRTTFLVTSRIALKLAGETVIDIEPLTEVEAVALFVDRAKAARPRLELTQADAPLLHRIVGRLDCVPLAVELCATRAAVLSLEQIDERLWQRFRLLARDARGLHSRQATLRATIDWSWDLLDEAEREALAQCSVFRGGFDIEAAEAVVDLGRHVPMPWTLDVLQSLRDKSLLRTWERGADPGAVRFGMYESVREYAAEKLAGEAAMHRHVMHFVDRSEVWAAAAHGPEAAATRKRIEVEQENLLAAVGRSLAARPPDGKSAISALLTLEPVLGARFPRVFLEWLDRVLEGGGELPPELHARALVARAEVRRLRGELRDASADLERVLSLAGDDQATTSRALIQRALIERTHGRLDDALQTALQSVACAHAAGARSEEAYALERLGTIHWYRGELDAAVASASASLALSRVIGDREIEGEALHAIGIFAVQRDQLEIAEPYYLSALNIARALGQRVAETNVLNNLAVLHMLRGDLDQARVLCGQGLVLAREWGLRQFHAVLEGNLGILELRARRLPEARAHAEFGISIFKELGDRRFLSWFVSWLAVIDAIEGKLEVARERLDQASVMVAGIGDRLMEAAVQLQRGHLDLAEGKVEAARARIAHAIAPEGPNGRSLAAQSDNVRVAIRALEQSLEGFGATVPPPRP